jgi:F-box/leucine-rich repeat protein 10/11
MVDEVVKVTLHAGNTMIIPTGWIHAVVSTSAAVISKTMKDWLFL